MKSISKKITLNTVLLVCLALFVMGGVACSIVYNCAVDLTRTSILEIAEVMSERVRWEIEAYHNIAKDLGTSEVLCDPSSSKEEKQAILDAKTAQYGLQRCNYIDASGNGIDGNNYSDRAYYQSAMKGEAMVSEPLVSKVTGKLTIIIAAPLWKDGIANSEAIGCVYVVPDEEFLNEIMRSTRIGKNGVAFVLDKNGTLIASIDSDSVKAGVNFIALAEMDKAYAGMASLGEKMITGESGTLEYSFGGTTCFSGYLPLRDTNGWSLAVYAPAGDFLSSTYNAIIITLVVNVISAIIAVILSIRLGRKIGGPVSKCTERIKLLAEGDLSSPVPVIRSKDETGVLAEATDSVVSSLNNIIGSMGGALGQMAEGNLAVDISDDERFYVGDFGKLAEYVKSIDEKLSDTMGQIGIAADQVSAGSEQVSAGAQALSQGATEQASSIEELAATIHEISGHVNTTSRNCSEARQLVNETSDKVNEANEEMNRLTSAMNNINDTSNQIGNIIKTIEDIAFQTNILALNAAVEAARAGEAGKGFAVVADEVRNLASKSAEAASNTTKLIEQTVEAVRNGTEITAATAESMNKVGEYTAKVENIVISVADASEQQADMIDQITTGVEQISGVVQNNSATAEESAASAEELSSQASMLRELVASFKVK
ncbi:MAG: methyl-accepting chemotaxis protein [Oscillospiraceae bacterium]|nr:methyl-accepting chemotaxis protein [Oscillospiraceae bacterium]